jgi:hypothetical protein
MKYSIIFLTLFSGLILTACDRPVVEKTSDTVIVPVPTPVPGPAGAPGATGESGATGEQGATGKPGDEGVKGDPGKASGDTVIIVPPAEVAPPAN